MINIELVNDMKGWERKKIGEVCNLYQGLAINVKTKHYLVEKSDLPLLRIKDLKNNTVEQYVDPNNYPQSCLVNEEDLIYTRTGQIGLVFMGRFGILHNNSFKIVPDESLLKEYLFLFLQSDNFKEKIVKLSSRAAQPDITHKLFKEQIIFVPPLSEQKRIVSIVDEAFEAIDIAIDNTKQNLTNARELFDSYLNAIFTQKGDGWMEKKLGNTCIVERGSSPRPIQNFFTNSLDGVNWIKIGDTKGVNKYIYSTNQKITQEGAKQSRRVEIGDFILTNSMSYGKPYIMATTGYIHDGWFVLRLADDINKGNCSTGGG
jgi:type I restriction enzyme, S subunit